MTNFKPMLSATLDDVSKLKFPTLASPKLDGIRAMVIDGVLVSRNLKPIPNLHTQKLFGRKELNGLDGELIVGDPTNESCFRDTSSGVMSVDGQPDVLFHVFDYFLNPEAAYYQRLELARMIAGRFNRHITVVTQDLITTEQELLTFEEAMLGQGYEGVMLRSSRAPYKFGRGTLKAQDLMKLKRFADAEAEIIGFEEQMHNTNEAKRDKLGNIERSSRKAGLVGKGTLGALIVRGINGPYKGATFNIGTGFDDTTRKTIWAGRHGWLGAVVKYKFFPTGSKEAPRFPVFIGRRYPGDMS